MLLAEVDISNRGKHKEVTKKKEKKLDSKDESISS
jgi:hypothetical protein